MTIELLGYALGLISVVWLLSWALWPGQRKIKVQKVVYRP